LSYDNSSGNGTGNHSGLESNGSGSGTQVGTEAFHHAERQGDEYCGQERQRIDAANRPKILALRASVADLREQEGELLERIRQAPPAGDLRMRQRKARRYWCVVGILTSAAFVFSILTFEPYRFGCKGWLYCVGIAIVTPFLVDRTLEVWESNTATRLVRFGTTFACIAALGSLLLLSVVRGYLLRQQIEQSHPAVVIEGEASSQNAHNDFYKETLSLLQIAMALLTLAMEIGAGLACHEARRWGADSDDDAEELRERLRTVREKMIACVHGITELEQESVVWERQFRRDFARTRINGAGNGLLKTLGVLAVAVGTLFAGEHSFAQERINLVVVPDLSASVAAAKGMDNKTELDRNIVAVSQLLARTPANSRITVLAITDRSFAQPYVLLAARLDGDAGYFQERIQSARAELVQVWQKRSASLASRFRATDLLGAVVVAGQLFNKQTGERNILVILSDMREETRTLNLARPLLVRPASALQKIEQAHLVADLKGVEVYVLGVDAAGKSVAYWESLREFWVEYFKKAGANLRSYSMFRELPDFGH